MKKQVFVIHGGDTFETYEDYLAFIKSFEIDFERYRTGSSDWKRSLIPALGEAYEVIFPDMPNKINAKYLEWKIWFEKFIPHCNPGIIFVGHSLGGTFLAKYLSENKFPVSIRALFLVAPPFGDNLPEYTLADFALPQNFALLEKQVPKIFLYQSEDDPVVPFSDFKKYQIVLKNAVGKTFTNRGHFKQPTFPELVDDVKNLA